MKKAITSKYGKSVTVIERANWSIKFYDVETGRHYTRRVWYPVSGSDIYVQHRGGFYSIATEFEGRYNPQAISRYDVVTPEELAAMAADIIEHRAGKQYTDNLTWEEVTRIYAYAIICRNADDQATMNAVVNGILQDSSKQPETIQTTQAVKNKVNIAAKAMNAAQREERATAAAAIEYDAESAEEHAAAARTIAKYAEALANEAAEYAAEAGTGEAASAADAAAEYAAFARRYADSATETAEQATAEAKQRAAWMEANPEQAAYIEDEAAAHQWSAEETASAIEYRMSICAANRAACALLDAYAEAIGEYPHEDDDETRAAYKVARDEITGISARATEYDREVVADMVDAIAARWTQDHEPRDLFAELAEYEAEATKAGRWTPEAARDLMSICERHELSRPREWHITVDMDETAQDFTDTSADGAETAEEARELLRTAWNRRKPRRQHLAEDTARILDTYSI